MMTVTDQRIIRVTELISSNGNPELISTLEDLLPLMSSKSVSRCILAFTQGLAGQKKAVSHPQPTKAK